MEFAANDLLGQHSRSLAGTNKTYSYFSSSRWKSGTMSGKVRIELADALALRAVWKFMQELKRKITPNLLSKNDSLKVKSVSVMNRDCATDFTPNFGSVFTRNYSSNVDFYAAYASNGVLHD